MASTPLELDIALWYAIRSRGGDFGDKNGDNNFNAPGVQGALKRFVEAGLLKAHEPNADLPQRYIATEGMHAFIQAICAVPWPVRSWTIPSQYNVGRAIGGLGGTDWNAWGANQAGTMQQGFEMQQNRKSAAS